MGPRPDRPALLRAQLRRRRRVLAVAGAVLLAGVLWRWDGYADAGDAEASLAAFLHDQVEVDAESVLWWGETGALTYRPALFRGRVDPSQPHDLYFVRARLTDDGVKIPEDDNLPGVWFFRRLNITPSPSAYS